MDNLDNLLCEILYKMIELRYPKICYKDNSKDYKNTIAFYNLYMFNSDKILNIKNIDDIVFKDNYMKENRMIFLELVNKVKEIINNEKFDKPYLEQGQFEKIVEKYNL